jgi:hypothetical protein
MFSFLLVSVISVLTLANYSRAAETPIRDPVAVSVLSQAINHAGGTAAINAIQDFTATGSITYHWEGKQVQGDASIKGRGRTQFRLDASLQDSARSVVVNDGKGSVKDIDGTTRPLFHEDLIDFGSPTLPVTQVLAVLQDTSTSIAFAGLVTQNGQQVEDIRVHKTYDKKADPLGIRTKLTTRDFFIVPSTFDILSVQDTAHPRNNSSNGCPHKMRFSDYRLVNGVLVPFAIIDMIGGQKTASIKLTQITFNDGLTDSDFQQQ